MPNKVYCIKKGSHNSGFHIGGTFSNKIKFKAIMHKNSSYSLFHTDQWDINKLFGFSTSWHHHIQSARIGWRAYGYKFQIFAYCYDKGVRLPPILLGNVLPETEFNCEIHDNKDHYLFVFSVDNDNININISKTYSNFPFRYYLYPYFGGNKSAPHNMNISINKL